MAFGLSRRDIAPSHKQDVHEILGAKDAQKKQQKNKKKKNCGICLLFVLVCFEEGNRKEGRGLPAKLQFLHTKSEGET
jgi:hypothetical protein